MYALVTVCVALLSVSFEETQGSNNGIQVFVVRQDNSNVYVRPYSAQKLLGKMRAAVAANDRLSESAHKKSNYFNEPEPYLPTIPFIGRSGGPEQRRAQPVIVHKKQAKIMEFFDNGRRDISSDETARITAVPEVDRTGAPPDEEDDGLIKADVDNDDDDAEEKS